MKAIKEYMHVILLKTNIWKESDITFNYEFIVLLKLLIFRTIFKIILSYIEISLRRLKTLRFFVILS
jgi:hypothetical protein